jgi:hypothetical protein
VSDHFFTRAEEHTGTRATLHRLSVSYCVGCGHLTESSICEEFGGKQQRPILKHCASCTIEVTKRYRRCMRRYGTSRKVADSRPDDVIEFFQFT